MKLRLSIILLAAALAATPAAGQTIKSLGYNTTNGQVVYGGTNRLTFTNSLTIASQTGSVLSVGTTDVQIRRDPGSGSLIFTANGNTNTFEFLSSGTLRLSGPLSFDATTNALGYAAATRTNLGGTTVGNSVFTATNAAAAATAIGLGTTNAVTFGELQLGPDFVLTQTGELEWIGTSVFSAETGEFYTPITFNTNVTVNGNATLNGVANTAPSQTASSGASLMTRDLVGQELANPRNKIQTTYWFGLEGLGEWSLIGSGALSAYVSPAPGFGSGRSWYSSHMVGTNHSGAGLRLGSDVSFGATGPYRFSDGGALTMRGRIRRHDTVGVPALAFVMGTRTATQMWQQDAYGLYFVPQPTNVWTSNGVVTQHDRISVSNVVWAVNTAGTNDTTGPTWTDLIGSLVTNGSAVYRNLGPHTSNNWVLGIGSTNASQVVMTNTGKTGLTRNNRSEVVLKLRIDGTTNTPYTVYGTVENNTGESTEVSLTTTNNDQRQPQFWNRADDLGTRTNSVLDLFIKYFSIDGTLNPL